MSRSKFLLSLACLTGLFLTLTTAAETPTTTPAIAEDQTRYLAKIELHTEGEIADLFERASQLLDEESSFAFGEPIAFVLHGPEVKYFSKDNYREFKGIVDKAAQLDAFRVIDVRVCSTYMKLHNISPESLPPFIEIVPYGPAEERRLRSSGYVDF
ncbi:DsrE family protein [Hahella ganghwensis]|uniref:DsrE family protein n=1 Tax=Hahella ganghwensis TaxID=286420 RepID=UPI00037775F3|nr:DsrE family protein [Hahella ganghwensis]